MSRKPRVTTDRLLDRQRVWLLTGSDWAFLEPTEAPGGLGGFSDTAEAREAWTRHREALIHYWIQPPELWEGPESFANPRPGGPGTRPAGFWMFEAKAPRHVTAGDPARQPELRALGWGSEEAWRAFRGRAWGPHLRCETERAYLERHRLLLEGEEPALAGPGGLQAVE